MDNYEISDSNLSLLANTIRALSADGVEKANSGHPGMPLGMADLASVLWGCFLRFNPEDPSWPGRDRFIVSNGHGSMLLYSLLHLFRFGLTLEDLKGFRQFQSLTPGHPEFRHTTGVEVTTGPLGQGVANSVGIALSGKLLEARYKTDLFRYKVYCFAGDGDLMEGVAHEAISLAGHLGLDNLVVVYDDNDISIGGSTDVCFSEDVKMRFLACGWEVYDIDGHDLSQIKSCFGNLKGFTGKPTLIIAKTVIGKGSPTKAGSESCHGSPLGEDEVRGLKEKIGFPPDKAFYVPDDVYQLCADVISRRKCEYNQWIERYKKWQRENSGLYGEYITQIEKALPNALKAELCECGVAQKKASATRNISGELLQLISSHMPGFIGGSADLEPSNKTLIKGSSDISKDDYSGKNLRFGVREHAMGAIANGLSYSGAWIPYTATFLVFSDYMRPAIRIAALSGIQTLFIFTHDSFWVGEDGPTHQPVEHIMSLRLIPNLYVFRPADGLECAMSYWAALKIKDKPSALLFTRQGVPPIERERDFDSDNILKGGYVVTGRECTSLVIVATGSEVSLAVAAAKLLQRDGIAVRVVSMPCWELFFEQSEEYRESIIPAGSKRVSIEAGVTTGWERFTGHRGLNIGWDSFGASAPGKVLAEKFGFSPEQVAERIKNFVS
ncbi:MAG: transketolase [Candidatus Dadabacteria bacterium]|nr:MAG: transketolase [Candidatus Dadabacteria bacterium]